MYRKTYIEINLNNLKYNVSTIIKHYSNYQYYIGVVKANCYGHGIKSIKSIIDGGCNYLAVATLEEALEVRGIYKDIPILCLGNILPQYLPLCIENNITITINSLEYIKLIDTNLLNKLKVHIKINTGMNRLGIKTHQELLDVISYLKNYNTIIEGIYTHIYDTNSKEKTNLQFRTFENFIKENNLEDIPIIHCQASGAITNYPKPNFINGCRFGIIMYGFTNNKKLNLKSTFKLYSQIIQIQTLQNNETVGYNGLYKGKQNDLIGVVSIGYADGIIRKNSGRKVYINNKTYSIIGNICMDMLFIKIDKTTKLYDQVEIIKDIEHIENIAKHLGTIPYEILCSISNRVPRFYIDK